MLFDPPPPQDTLHFFRCSLSHLVSRVPSEVCFSAHPIRDRKVLTFPFASVSRSIEFLPFLSAPLFTQFFDCLGRPDRVYPSFKEAFSLAGFALRSHPR